MLILLVGPKGSGKSHIGRILEARCDVRFFDVEPLWLTYHMECEATGAAIDIGEGIRRVDGKLREALATSEHVAVETTGASHEILAHMLTLGREHGLLTVRVEAPLAVCLDRIATRDQRHQIPVDEDIVRRVHGIASALMLPADVVLNNVMLSEKEIVELVSPGMT